MLSDIVHEVLESRPDVEIVAALELAAPLEAAVLDHAPELVIVSEDEFDIPASWLELLEAHPGLRFLALASAGHRGAVCEVLGDLPPDELVTLITARGRDTQPPVPGA